ncbi:tRNA dihydrouridine synthase DusB [Candidatus Woesearchaeota archaeon]|jgi:tRNA-dihydrouridine synthase B|nr:tRNA dihydrouridine synthase DusB [Candidatus Woesearchaeota archaeon]MBT4835075.1 tRNA dihydrouridine synthase DusB [Candidatus Woesearchaeota archaeon]MBT6735149.1 tRNA dihydrouridine synthase DusB [Candidatus Woesearchaeota archaeon]MBT7474714.1 tRNA dihydrouridine synthase DusB [Candidatus Woesearchaeota archaeon]
MKFESRVFLAPMADVTDAAFRILCSNYGAGLTYTEMISSTALANSGKNKLFDVQECEKPIAVQLMGNNLDHISKAVKRIDDKIDLIDFNMGCPMKKIVNAGCGAALMKNPIFVKKIVNTLVKSTKKPISIKIRSGWDSKSINVLEIAKIAEKEGASMITVHPKTQSQLRDGEANWNLIKEVKDNLSIPVIGNGEVWNVQDIEKMLSETNCDYVMIGRAATKNPYIFKQYNDYLKTGKFGKLTNFEMIRDYLELAEKYQTNFNYVRGHVMYMTKGVEGSAKLRKNISEIRSIEELKKLI